MWDSKKVAAMTLLYFPHKAGRLLEQNSKPQFSSQILILWEHKGVSGTYRKALGSAWCESVQAQSCSLHLLLLCPSTKSCLGEVAEYMRIGGQPAGNASQGTADSILGRELLSSVLWMWQLGWEWGTLTFELLPRSAEEEIRHTQNLA